MFVYISGITGERGIKISWGVSSIALPDAGETTSSLEVDASSSLRGIFSLFLFVHPSTARRSFSADGWWMMDAARFVALAEMERAEIA